MMERYEKRSKPTQLGHVLVNRRPDHIRHLRPTSGGDGVRCPSDGRNPFTAIFLGNRLLGTILLEQNDESAVQRARLIPERWTAERTNLACWFDVLIQAKDI